MAGTTQRAHQSYVFWIDEDMKNETQAAMKNGKTFPEVNNVFDFYRVKSGGSDE